MSFDYFKIDRNTVDYWIELGRFRFSNDDREIDNRKVERFIKKIFINGQATRTKCWNKSLEDCKESIPDVPIDCVRFLKERICSYMEMSCIFEDIYK